jgi:1-aminocyclopropane-1-carboxylate deaminase
MFSSLSPEHIAVQDISHLNNHLVEVHVLRLDRLHPLISGNKWFKLAPYLNDAKKHNKTNIITFGGAWSNHIVATAAFCKMQGLRSTGVIRGEVPDLLSPTLQQASDYGMALHFISRTEYKDKQLPEELNTPDTFVIAEGGYGVQGAAGAASILDYCTHQYSHICCAVGTGTTLAGIINAANRESTIIGISVMKNNRSLENSITTLLCEPRRENWQLFHDFHFDGYAKYQPSLLQFMNEFYQASGIPTDFVYTGKLFYAINDLIKNNFFRKESRVLIVHTGGLQGNASLRKGILLF